MKGDIREPALSPAHIEPFQSAMENDLVAFFAILKDKIDRIDTDDPEAFISELENLI